MWDLRGETIKLLHLLDFHASLNYCYLFSGGEEERIHVGGGLYIPYICVPLNGLTGCSPDMGGRELE